MSVACRSAIVPAVRLSYTPLRGEPTAGRSAPHHYPPSRGCPLHEPTNRRRARHPGTPAPVTSPAAPVTPPAAPVTLPASQRERAHQSAGLPFPRGATWDGQRREFLAVFREARNRSSCACSTPPVKTRPASASASAPTAPGICTCPISGRISSMATACTVPTIRTPGFASIPTSSCSIPTRKRSAGN